MSQTTLESERHLALPHVRCPSCGEHMRLAGITPDPGDRYEIKFVCACGFDYHMTASLDDDEWLYAGQQPAT